MSRDVPGKSIGALPSIVLAKRRPCRSFTVFDRDPKLSLFWRYEMVVKEIVIKNPSGLQSKAAAVFIQKASGYKSSIWVFKGDKKANGKSLLGILSLEIGKGDKIKLSVEGEDEAEVAAELEEYLVTDTGDIG